MMIKTFLAIFEIYKKIVSFIKNRLSCFLLLSIRIWIGLIFLKAGLTKTDNFDTTIMLFTYEYMIPFFSPILLAILATFFEIICGFCLIFGFLTRLSSLPFIAMTIVIQSMVFQNQEHFYWLFLLTTLMIYGGGRLSIDHFLLKFIKKIDDK